MQASLLFLDKWIRALKKDQEALVTTSVLAPISFVTSGFYLTSLDIHPSHTQWGLICHTPCMCVVSIRWHQNAASECVVSFAASKVEVAEWHPSRILVMILPLNF